MSTAPRQRGTVVAVAPIQACGLCKRAIPDGCDGRQYAFKWPSGEPGIACRGRWGSDLDQVGDFGQVRLEIDRVTVPGELRFDDPRREFRTYLALKYRDDDRPFAEKARLLAHVRGFVPSPEAAAVIKSDPMGSNPITRARP